jgi:hypothetical protein
VPSRCPSDTVEGEDVSINSEGRGDI